MANEIENIDTDKIEETETKLVVICKLCNQNFSPSPYECPYLYHPEMGVHVPLCNLCRSTLIQERAEND